MTVAQALTALAVRFLAIDVAGQSDPLRAVTTLRDAVNVSDFPLVVLRKATGATVHTLGQETLGLPGLGLDRYQVEWHILIAPASVPTEEADELLQPWGRALLVALLADLSLGGAVHSIGEIDSTGRLCDYQQGLVTWIDSNRYWGLRGLLQIQELVSAPVG